jgi:hypothetical protein
VAIVDAVRMRNGKVQKHKAVGPVPQQPERMRVQILAKPMGAVSLDGMVSIGVYKRCADRR